MSEICSGSTLCPDERLWRWLAPGDRLLGSADLPRVLNVSVDQSERSRGSQGPIRDL